MKSSYVAASLAVMLLSLPVQAASISVVSNAIEDSQYINGATDRFEQILGLNNTRFGAVRFDTSVIAPYASASRATLTSAKLVLTEESGRDSSHNGTQTADVGAYFINTTENSGWTAPVTFAWHGNTNARPGDFGSPGGDNNIDARSTSDPIEMAGNAFRSGVSQQSHTFVTGVLDVVEIDLTEAGGSLTDIQAIMADWVAGSNAGLGLEADVSGQIMFRSVATASGTEGGTGTGLPGALANGSSLDGQGGVARLELTFEIPEPGSVALSLLALVGLGVAGTRRCLG